MWRRVFGLSATFLLTFFIAFSCKKKDTLLGMNSINPDGLLAGGGVDTFSLKTFSELDDTVITKNSTLSILGSYHDPVFGKMSAAIYTQFRLPSFSPVFEPAEEIIVDSMILALRYAGFNGKSDNQIFEVYELADSIAASTDSSYYDFSATPLKPDNWVLAGKENITMKPTTNAIVDTISVSPQLRIPLDTVKAKKFINDARNATGEFQNETNFADYFRGLCIRTNNPPQSKGTGGIGYFNLIDQDSKMIIYYRVRIINGSDTTYLKKTFNFNINSSCQRYNQVVIDRSGTNVQNVLNNPALGQKEFYAQAFGTRAVIQLTSISDLPKTAIIHSAELFLPIQFQTGSSYQPGTEVTLATRFAGDNVLSLLSFGTYSDFRKGFVLDIRGYVQQVVAGKIANSDLYISPRQFITSADRIVFNGVETMNKVQPKLSIIYTEF